MWGDNPAMDRTEATAILRDHAADLRRRGVVRVALFRSTVRDEARPNSDIDVLVDIRL
jgi:hypothetical protein